MLELWVYGSIHTMMSSKGKQLQQGFHCGTAVQIGLNNNNIPCHICSV